MRDSSTTGKPTKKGARRGVSFEALCRMAEELPGVTRGIAYRTPALRVAGKFLLRLREDGETVALLIPMDERDLLLEADPEVFFVTDHYRPHPAIVFRLAKIRRGQLADLLERAWRARAPKKLIRAREVEPAEPGPAKRRNRR